MTECMEMVENMDVVDAVREERLERVRLRQLEWVCRMMCKELVMEMVDRSAELAERRVCSDWVTTTLVDSCWIALEYGRVMEEILDAGANLTLNRPEKHQGGEGSRSSFSVGGGCNGQEA